MGFIHNASWFRLQIKGGGHRKLGPNWGTPGHWRQETNELITQQTEIEDAMNAAALF